MLIKPVLAGLYSLGLSFRVSLVGQLFASELLPLLFLPFARVNKLLGENVYLRRYVLGLLILMVSLVVSDYYNRTDFYNSIRGVSNIGFSILDVIFLYFLFRRSNYSVFVYLLVRMCTEFVFGGATLDTVQASENANSFKILVIPYLRPFIAISATLLYLYNRRLSGIFIILSALFVIYSGARSVGLVFFVSGLLVLFGFNSKKARLGAYLPSIVVGIVGLYGAYIAYVNYALKYGDEYATVQLSRAENPYNPIEFLQQGRTETFVAVSAIQDRPLMGFGSWAEDKDDKYALRTIELRGELAISSHIDHLYIPGHSILLTAWLWAGFGGFVGAMVSFWFLLRAFWKSLDPSSQFYPIIVIFACDFVWHFMFSPIGHLRQSAPFIVALLAVAALRADQGCLDKLNPFQRLKRRGRRLHDRRKFL